MGWKAIDACSAIWPEPLYQTMRPALPAPLLRAWRSHAQRRERFVTRRAKTAFAGLVGAPLGAEIEPCPPLGDLPLPALTACLHRRSIPSAPVAAQSYSKPRTPPDRVTRLYLFGIMAA